jgi:nicotinate-nucleotide--dimethylbenzimidazole phosphoribosyltransferase
VNIQTTPPRLNSALRAELEAKIRGKAKPIGALGRLEELAIDIGVMSGSLMPELGAARLIVFAGDHGITAEGVTAYPSAVTREVAKLILAGTGGANICARSVGIDVLLVDAGLGEPLDPHEVLVSAWCGPGTRNARREPAMSPELRDKAFHAGRDLASRLAAEGVGIFALGEIGIGNSSSAALLSHAVTGLPLPALVGPGAGVPAQGLDHKVAVLEETYARARTSDAWEALRQFAGFEMVAMAGAMVGAAEAGKLVLIDGFIATSAAAAVLALVPWTRRSFVFAHRSVEPGHNLMLEYLHARPLLDLEMRLGEGTGAALAVPLVRAAERLLTELADLPGEHPV